MAAQEAKTLYSLSEQEALESNEEFRVRARVFVIETILPRYAFLQAEFVEDKFIQDLVDFLSKTRDTDFHIAAELFFNVLNMDDTIHSTYDLEKDLKKFMDSTEEFNIIVLTNRLIQDFVHLDNTKVKMSILRKSIKYLLRNYDRKTACKLLYNDVLSLTNHEKENVVSAVIDLKTHGSVKKLEIGSLKYE